MTAWVIKALYTKENLMTHQAGGSGRQALPDKFQVTDSGGSQPSQEIFINREINMHSWMLDDQVTFNLHPSQMSKWPVVLLTSTIPISWPQ